MDSKKKDGKKKFKRSTASWHKSFRLEGECSVDFSKIPVKRRNTEGNRTQTKSSCFPKANTNVPLQRTPNKDSFCPESQETLSGELLLNPQHSVSELYSFALAQNNGVVFLDNEMQVCALMDWDEHSMTLKKVDPVIVQLFPDVGYSCTCDPDRLDFLNRVSTCTSKDLNEHYKQCVHIDVLSEMITYFMKIHGVVNLERNTVDHSYSQDSSQHDEYKTKCFQKLNWCLEDTFAVSCSASQQQYCIIGTAYGKLKCISCRKSCQHVAQTQKLLEGIDLATDDDGYDLFELIQSFSKISKPYSLRTLSKKKIPFYLSPSLKAKYIKNPSDLFILENKLLQVIPVEENVCAACGGQLAPELSAADEQSSVYTRFLQIPVQCFTRKCSTCEQLSFYDGQEDCILNMGRFLIHHHVMRDYMFQFFHSRSTLAAFYNTWCQHQEDGGNIDFRNTLQYSHFRWSWYCFMKLLDIDYEKAFVCEASSCGKVPDILLFDGTSLAFQRVALPELKLESDVNTKLHKGSYLERIFIGDRSTRSYLRSFARCESTSAEEYRILINNVKCFQPCLLPLLPAMPDCPKENESKETYQCPKQYRKFFRVLTSDSPVCATFHYTDLDLLYAILKLQPHCEPPTSLMKELQQRIPVIYEMISDLGCIPNALFPVFEAICAKVCAPFLGKEPVCSAILQQDISTPLACFPALPVKGSRGKYVADKNKQKGTCTKTGTRHPTLLPGIFTVFCPHGICYGFELMATAESPNVPFTFMKTRFERPPRTVIYDNACNLFEYCLNRDPVFFKNTHFLIDGLHWPNHRNCAQGYEALSYPGMRNVNTQIVEQNNGKLKKLKSSLSYMKPENFMATLKLFLWHSNEQINKKKYV